MLFSASCVLRCVCVVLYCVIYCCVIWCDVLLYNIVLCLCLCCVVYCVALCLWCFVLLCVSVSASACASVRENMKVERKREKVGRHWKYTKNEMLVTIAQATRVHRCRHCFIAGSSSLQARVHRRLVVIESVNLFSR